jgi:hypothetical protein
MGKKRDMLKSLYNIHAFPYFVKRVVTMSLFKLWLLTLEYVCFLHFIYDD